MSSSIPVDLSEDKILNNGDMVWLQRLINMKLSDRNLSECEQQELRKLSSKLQALDNSIWIQRNDHAQLHAQRRHRSVR